MIKFFVILLFLLSSCAYPDIDTVPDFKEVIITKEDSIELCKFSNPYTGPSKVLITVVPVTSPCCVVNSPCCVLINANLVQTYRYININYERLKCFDVLNINTNRYGL